MRMATVRHVAAASALLLAGCRVVTGPFGAEGEVRATATSDAVRVVNEGPAPAFFVTFGREAVSRILWAPCVDAARCPPLAPGDVRTVPRPVEGDQAEREAVVYWWRAVPGADGALRPDSIRTIVVTFP
jgi:hypothetical protein